MATARDPAGDRPDDARVTSRRRTGTLVDESGEALAETMGVEESRVSRPSIPADEPRRRSDDEDPILEPGTLLSSSYRVEELLGQGGMGVVYVVEHVDLGRRFAAKVVNRGVDEDRLARLQKEARVASGIRHPNIVDVVHLGRREDGSVFVVMELLEGEDLGHRLERQADEHPDAPWLPTDELRAYTAQMFDALGAAHAAGVVHRDLKPDNVFLAEVGGERVVKLLDFGIAKAADPRRDHRLTRTGQIIGTPLYMAPEQTKSTSEVDERADLYSMGVILYEMAVGAPPFEAETLFDLIVQHATKPPTPPRDHRPDLPEAVEAVILRCLEKAREDRFESVEELAKAWDDAWEGRDRAPTKSEPGGEEEGAPRAAAEPASEGAVAAPEPEVPAAAPESPVAAVEAESVAVPVERGGASRAPVIAVAALAALAIVGGGAWWAVSSGDPEPTPPGASAQAETASETLASAEPPAPLEAPPPEASPPEASPPEAAASEATAAVTRRVTSEPSGAEVSRDGTVIGTTPLDVEVPPGESVELSLSAEGHEDTTVVLEPGETGAVEVELTARRQRTRRVRTQRSRSRGVPASGSDESSESSESSAPREPESDSSGGLLLGMDAFDAEREGD